MTDLQLGLIGLGGGAVVAVLAYNKWQELRQRKVAEQAMRRDHDDVLLGNPERAVGCDEPPLERREERREPVLASAETALPAADKASWDDEIPLVTAVDTEVRPPQRTETFMAPAVERSEPELPVLDTAQTLEEENAAADVPAGAVPTSLIDTRIDFIASMDLVEMVPAGQIIESQRDALSRLKKPVVWVGFNERQREWEIMQPEIGRAYRRLRIALQLADRRGPLAEADFTIFVAAMQQLADDLMAVVDMNPSIETLQQALEIDRFCAEVDLEIGVHLVSKGIPFAGTKIRALAEAAGMLLGSDGLFTRHDDEGRALFSLQNYETTAFASDSIKNLTTHGLTFLLDVPRTDHGERVFFQMLDLARRYAEALQGTLVDDNRQPLNEAQLDHIKREYVLKPQAAMAAYGIAAGSPQALRLFS